MPQNWNPVYIRTPLTSQKALPFPIRLITEWFVIDSDSDLGHFHPVDVCDFAKVFDVQVTASVV
jgi:hypothetical protein